MNAGSGIEHGRQQCIVAGTLSGGPIDGLENRFDLLVLQIIDHALPGTFEWDAENSLRQFHVLGVPGGDEVKERMKLGFFGMDFGIDRQGQIVLFEANATMNFFPLVADPRFAYLERIRRPASQAFMAMLGLQE